MSSVKVVVHDYTKGRQVLLGPYSEIEIHLDTVWVKDESGRKVELASKSAGFWYLKDGEVEVKTKNIKVNVNHEIKAAAADG